MRKWLLEIRFSFLAQAKGLSHGNPLTLPGFIDSFHKNQAPKKRTTLFYGPDRGKSGETDKIESLCIAMELKVFGDNAKQHL